MASVRAGRDARGAMNDLPTPGQPDFDMNTMRPASPTPQPNVPPAPLPPEMTQFAPMPYAEPYHSMNIPPPPDPVDAKINRLMASAPQDPSISQTHPNPVPPEVGVPNTGIPSLKPGGGGATATPASPSIIDKITNRAGADQVPQTGGAGPGGQESSLENLQRNQNPNGFDIKKLVAMGVPIALAALLARALSKGRGGGNTAAELERVLGRAGEEVAPHTGVTTPYADDAIAPVSDATRHRVNEAYGEDKGATPAKMDKTQRQMDIDAGTIPPEDYAKGEKPRPGTDGYKQWFKYRQSLSKSKLSKGSTSRSTMTINNDKPVTAD